MPGLRYDMDDQQQYEIFRARHTDPDMVEALPRKHAYGTDEAKADGLEPFGELDKLVPEDDFEKALEYADANKTLPMYHQQATWAPPGKQWSQDGLPWCWAWSATATLLDTRAREGKETVLLAPVTLGEAVNWRDVGYYLEDTSRFLAETGVAPASCVPDSAWHSRNPREFDDCWETERSKYRLGRRWDANPQLMTQHSLSMLTCGVSLYAAWNHLGHAMSICGMVWNTSVYQNLDWVVRNSHGEDEPIIMNGRNAVPDVVIGFVNSLTVE